MRNGHRTWALHENSNATTILVVDDDDVCRGVLTDLLRAKGYVILEAENGEQGRELLEQHYACISLIISDILMPGGNGLEMLAALRQHRPDIPVILITGQTSIDDAVKGMLMGAAGYLSKPINTAKLFALIQESISLHKKNQVNWKLAFAHNQGPAGYIVEKQIGEGTFGDVFLVHKDGHPYALKTIRTFGISSNQQKIAKQRFLHECEVLKTLHHPNIVAFYEYGMTEKEQIPYLVMEYFPGDPWEDLLAKPLRLRLEMLVQAAKGLGAIHQAGFCHRDIKPGNLLASCAQRTVKWGDFGLIRLPMSTITMSGQTLGSPAYMAPEACLSSHFDYRADIFSMGVLAYELLTGKPAFDGQSLPQIMEAILHRHPVDPQLLNPEIPTELQKSLGRMLRKDPKDRPASLQETISEWETCLENGSWTRHRSHISLKKKLLNLVSGKKKTPLSDDGLPLWMSSTANTK
jgi:serine/threonine protein kinase